MTLIRERLTQRFQPTHLEIQDDSKAHEGHLNANTKEGSHFNLYIVSHVFDNTTLLQRHRLVYEPLNDLILNQTIHALSIKALSPRELPASDSL